LSVSPARLAAFKILLRVQREDSYASELLHSSLTDSLQESDLRLATELVFGTLRQQRLLDHLLASCSAKSLNKLDAEVLAALRLGAFQLLFLQRVPGRAAVHESVELVKAARLKSATGFVNAVLRKVGNSYVERTRSAFDETTAAALSVRFSHPEWLVERWLARFGQEKLVELLEHNNRAPKVYFRINSPDVTYDELSTTLASQAVRFKAHTLSRDVFEVIGGNLHATTLFRYRRIAVQDAGSQLIPHLLDLKPSDLCLDLCAGIGGKSSQMARLKGSPSSIVATDLHWHRLQVARQLHSQNWKNLRWVTCDATRPLPFLRLFDKILVDAPCSGTGTLQRHPEIRWRLRPEQIREFQPLQMALLENAFQHLRPGGTIVYSTCSLEPEENEAVVHSFLSAHADASLAIPEGTSTQRLFSPARFLTLFPPETETDGFFGAVIRKGDSDSVEGGESNQPKTGSTKQPRRGGDAERNRDKP
jgi:16S rRNA (cytosine967-C5)-methyltransferase